MIFQKVIIRPNILQFTTTLQRNFFPWNGRLFSRKFTTINPYHILGVDKNADRSRIKQKFIELAKQHHPDVGGNPETFRKIRGAYEALIKCKPPIFSGILN